MGKKLLVALTLEGKFAGEGLHDIEDDDDMLAAMARELVEKDGIGETADAVWSRLKEIYDQLPVGSQQMPAADNTDTVFEDTVFEDPGAVVLVEKLPGSDMSQADLLVPNATAMTVPTLFGQTFPSVRRKGKRTRESDSLQGSLFSWN